MSFFATGIVGTCLFSLLLLGAIYNFYRAQNMGKTLISTFFATMIVYSTLEIPRYAFMIAQRDYKSKLGYCLHVTAVGFYFVALSVICFSWMFLLFIEKQDRIASKKRSIYIANVFLFVFVFLSVYFCVTAHSLGSYFDSKFYLVYMVAEVLLFIFYNSAVVFFGLKISFRFRNYIKTGGEKTDAFKSALAKVTILMVVNSVCAAVRVTMLILKIMHNVDSFDTSRDSFAHYGIIWFTLTDFIPFCIGGATFQLIMVTGGHRRGRQKPGSADEALLGQSEGQGASTHDLIADHDRNSRRSSEYSGGYKTPKQNFIVDSDIDDTPQTPEEDEEEGGSRRRALSYDANSSVTTNSPHFAQHGMEFSPHTPNQRWTSFNSSCMLPSSLSPAVPLNRHFAKSMSHLQSVKGLTPPPSRRLLSPLGEKRHATHCSHAAAVKYNRATLSAAEKEPAADKAAVSSRVARGVVSQRRAAAGGDTEDERNVISSLTPQDFLLENSSNATYTDE